MKIGLIPTYKEIFPDEPQQDLEYYFSGMSREFVLYATTYLLGFNDQNSDIPYEEFCLNYFSSDNRIFHTNVIKRIKQLEQRSSQKEGFNTKISLINPITSLMIFEYAFDYLDKNQVENGTGNNFEQNFFKAYLIFNERFIEFQNNFNKVVGDPNYNRDFALTITFATSDIANFDRFTVFSCQFNKAIYLFEFLESNPESRVIYEKFLEYFECYNWREYLQKIIPTIFAVLGNTENIIGGLNIISLPHDKYLQSNIQFLEKLSVDSNLLLTSELDFKNLRSKPFYKISETEYGVIYPLFLIEKIYNGLYFQLNELNNKLEKGIKIKNFRSFYGQEFSEKYLLYKVLDKTFKNSKAIKLSGEELRIKYQVVAEPDYYIRDWNNVFLFETKETLLNSNDKFSHDINILEKAFQERFYYKIENEKNSNKAILQLIENIKNILGGNISYDNINTKKIKIYPILILHNRQFEASGFNKLLNEWFEKELEKQNIDKKRVMPLTVINIDTLMTFERSFLNNKLKLDKLIDEYSSKYLNAKSKKNYLDFVRANEKTYVSFDEFIIKFANKSGIKRDKLRMVKSFFEGLFPEKAVELMADFLNSKYR